MKIDELYYGIVREITAINYIPGIGNTPYQKYLNSYIIHKTKIIDYVIVRKINDEKYQNILTKEIYTTDYNDTNVGDIFIDDRPKALKQYTSIINPNITRTSVRKIRKELQELKKIILQVHTGYLAKLIENTPEEIIYEDLKQVDLIKLNEHEYQDFKTKQTYKDYGSKPGEIIIIEKMPLKKEEELKTEKDIIKILKIINKKI